MIFLKSNRKPIFVEVLVSINCSNEHCFCFLNN